MFKRLLISTSLVVLSLSSAYAAPAPTSSKPQAPVDQNVSVNILTPRMRDAFIKQVAMEQYSSNLYLTFASYFGDVGYDGCEKFFRNSAAEEHEHSMLFYNLLIDRGEKFQLNAVNASALMPTSPLDAFTKLMENEIQVTKAIQNLYAIAIEENDYASQAFLHPFLLLQVQEEKEAQDLLQLMKTGHTDPAFLLVFDEKVGESVEKD